MHPVVVMYVHNSLTAKHFVFVNRRNCCSLLWGHWGAYSENKRKKFRNSVSSILPPSYSPDFALIDKNIIPQLSLKRRRYFVFLVQWHFANKVKRKMLLKKNHFFCNASSFNQMFLHWGSLWGWPHCNSYIMVWHASSHCTTQDLPMCMEIMGWPVSRTTDVFQRKVELYVILKASIYFKGDSLYGVESDLSIFNLIVRLKQLKLGEWIKNVKFKLRHT